MIEETSKIEVVPQGYLQNIVKVPAVPEAEHKPYLDELDIGHYQQRKENIITKLKKEYTATLNSRYVSESRPLDVRRDEEE